MFYTICGGRREIGRKKKGQKEKVIDITSDVKKNKNKKK